MARGQANHPVECLVCHRHNACPKDQLCAGCRVKLHTRRTAYPFTPEMDDLIRQTWRRPRSRAELTSEIDRLVALLRYPRGTIQGRACMLGVTFIDSRRIWPPEHIAFLRQYAGVRSPWWIARQIGRSYSAVKNKIFLLGLSARITEGYSEQQFCKLLGVAHGTVRGWVRRGWLKLRNGRITEAEAGRFVREHPEQYDLRRVDQLQFKTLAFPKFTMNMTAHAIDEREKLPARRAQARASEDEVEYETA